MHRDMFHAMENHMLSLMQDSAHDKEHIYRVLYTALDIVSHEKDVDRDVLIAACLLHASARENSTRTRPSATRRRAVKWPMIF